MATMLLDPILEDRLLAERRAAGADRYDEVWEGIYMMTPIPNDEHQQFVSRLVYILEDTVGIPGFGDVRPGVNLTDRQDDWTQNYRVPDVAVFMREGTAENRDTHWFGAADFLVEITSPGDRSREKIAFYESIGVVELLLIDRQPWTLELYRHEEGRLTKVGQSTVDVGDVLTSAVVPLTLQLVAGEPRPQIRVTHPQSERCWMV